MNAESGNESIVSDEGNEVIGQSAVELIEQPAVQVIEQSAVSDNENDSNTEQNSEIIQPSPSKAKPFIVKYEKAKLHVFSGDVRQYSSRILKFNSHSSRILHMRSKHNILKDMH